MVSNQNIDVNKKPFLSGMSVYLKFALTHPK